MATDERGSTKLGRNDPCPVCGRKMKKCRCRQRKIPSWVLLRFFLSLPLLVLVVGLTLYYNLPWRSPPPTVSSWEERVAASVRLIQGYAKRKPADRWWLQTVPDLSTQEAVLALVEQTDAVQAKIHRLLGQHRSVSPLAGEIAAAFPRSWVSIYNRGITQALVRGDTTQPFAPPAEAIEICFIPSDQLGNGRHPSHFYYHPGFRALMLSALEYPDGVISGLLFHELGHALRHRRGNPSATAPPGSDLYVAEELAMHQLETEVFNAFSGGRYLAVLDGILGREREAPNAREAILKLTERDLAELDACIGATACGPTISHAIVAQHALSLGLRHLEGQAAHPADQARQRADLYRWFVRSQPSAGR